MEAMSIAKWPDLGQRFAVLYEASKLGQTSGATSQTFRIISARPLEGTGLGSSSIIRVIYARPRYWAGNLFKVRRTLVEPKRSFPLTKIFRREIYGGELCRWDSSGEQGVSLPATRPYQ